MEAQNLCPRPHSFPVISWGSTPAQPPPSSSQQPGAHHLHPAAPEGARGPSLLFSLLRPPRPLHPTAFQQEEASSQALVVKNLPAVREMPVQSLGQEDALQEGTATHSSLLAWRILMDRGAWRALVQGVRVRHD